ncbi:hypothetical protein H2203_007888 [Taxawa tesnikishii (nom. ined.)]|nr:hypothetical protein H2203_007888 [Dothideales sp. JES 119]
MPLRASSDTVYRSTPALKQKKFPDRQCSVRSRSSLPPSTLQRQSTLTQLDTHFFVPPISSDAMDAIDDEEYIDDRPKKRRRTLNKQKSGSAQDRRKQATLTQIDFLHPLRHMGDDDDDLPSYMDKAAEHGVQRNKDASTSGMAFYEGIFADKVRKAQRIQDDREDEEQLRRYEKDQTVDLLKTPQAQRMREIPSSQSPESVLLSTQSRRSTQSSQRFPLKERSVNTPMTARSGKQTSPFKKISPFKQLLSPIKPMTPQSKSPIKQPMFREPPRSGLKRVTTIQDSDDSYIGEEPSPPRLKRKTTIPDSQWETWDEEVTSETETEPLDRSEDDNPTGSDVEHEEEADVEDDYDTYDPVYSALDRDEARRFSAASGHTNLTAAGPGGRDVRRATGEEELVPDSPRKALDEDQTQAQYNHELMAKSKIPSQLDTQAYFLRDDIEVVDLTSDDIVPLRSTHKGVEYLPLKPEGPISRQKKSPGSSPPSDPADIRSSPPSMAIPPSQATTVDITQLPAGHSQYRVPSSPPAFISNLQVEVVSSSSPARPPWSSPSKTKRQEVPSSDSIDNEVDLGNAEEGYRAANEVLPDSLLDFSLPPPPPMSSWRRR